MSVMLGVCVYTKSTIHRRWFLNVGLSRRIDTPYLLSRQMTVTSSEVHFSKSQLFVFHMGRHCPPLSSKPITLERNRTIHFSSEKQIDSDYDYFYLNEGSVIHLELIQTHGSSSVYLLRGQNVMERLINDVEQDSQGGFEKLAIDKRSLTAGSSELIQFTVTQADDYIVLYQNASPKRGRIFVEYRVLATTFDVDGGQSECDDPLGDCTIRMPLKEECVIVQSMPDVNQNLGQVIAFQTTKSKHRILLILALSLLPIGVALLIPCFCRMTPRRLYQPIGDVDLPDAGALPPIDRDGLDGSPVGIKFLGETFLQSPAIPIVKRIDMTSGVDPVVISSPSSIVHV
jgi:hypothetical protein